MNACICFTDPPLKLPNCPVHGRLAIERVFLGSATRRGRMQTRPHYKAAGLHFARKTDAREYLVKLTAAGRGCEAADHEAQAARGLCWTCKGGVR